MELHRLDGLDASGIDHMEVMDAQPELMLEGIDDVPEIAYEILDEDGNVVLYADAEENIYVIDGLNGFFRKIGRGLKKFTKNIGRKVIKPVVSTFNRFVNPATILLRNGFLLAMKANLMKVASRLRFGYLSEAQAKKMGIDMGKFRKLKKAVSKAEKIYRLAGGRGRNLRKAILKGKGNKDRKVPLSGFSLGTIDNEPDLFNDPFEKFVVESDLDTFEAFLNNEVQVDGLGAVATGPAMAAASGAVASISTVLNKIGNIFGQAQKVKQQAQTLFQKPRRSVPALPPPRVNTPIRSSVSRSSFRSSPFSRRNRGIPTVTTQNRVVRNQTTSTATGKTSWIERNKTPLLIGAVGLVAAGGVVIAMRSNKKSSKPISGVSKKSKTNGRDALGRFTKGHTIVRKKTRKKKAPEKLVAKAIL
ncbi:hypothetical protein U6A24_18330 [Aquimarina gracilis]|uniref:Uncharacterized protein n=1 Tax=Aquimarina gracilis TaxID=874422 RepID=A0ABU5ZZW1_9FLAO|nr:hypothetical protein [Aquimarina gracilis]MEB3347439.1 hypothetical protein [Aquimarina gracilis]